jgi:hypothetical protein
MKISYVAKHADGFLFRVIERTQYGADKGFSQKEIIVADGLNETQARAMAGKLMEEGMTWETIRRTA